MYLAIDIGGTKTLLACFDDQGQVTQSQKFATPGEYTDFLQTLKENYQALNLNESPTATAVAVPGRLNRETGEALGYGTLLWKPSKIQADIEEALGIPVVIENDSKLAGLSEGILILNEFKNTLYLTVSTGISAAIIVDGVIDPALEDSEAGQILIQDGDTFKQWEDVASGRAIVEKYGKRASELDDPKAWEEIASKLAVGIIDLIAIIQPEVIVFGGGVGAHFAKFEQPLTAQLKKLETPMTPVPPLRQAQRPEEAVIYGCYELLKAANERITA